QDQAGAQGAALTLSLTANDPDNDPLTFTRSGLPRGASVDARTGQFQWTPDFAQLGDYAVTVGVTDGNLSAEQSFTIHVAKTNRSPIMARPPAVLGQEGLRLSFQVAGGDPDGDQIVFFADHLPVGATF